LYYVDGVAVEGGAGGTGGADGGGGVGSDGPGRSRGRGRGRSRRSKDRSRSGSQSQSPKPQSGLDSGDNGLSPSAPRKLLTRPLQRHYETIVTLDGSGAGAGAGTGSGSGLGSGSGAGSFALRLEPEPNIHKAPPPQALPPRLQRHYRDAVARSQANEDGWAALVPGEPAPSAADGGGWLFDLTALLPPEPLQFDTDADKDRFEDLFGVTFAEVERLEEPIGGGGGGVGVGVGGGVARGVRNQSRWADMTDDVDDDRLLPTAKRSHSQAPTRVSASMAASAAAATATATATAIATATAASASSMPAAGKGGVVTIPAPAAEATDSPLSPSPPSSAPAPAQALQPQPQQSLPSSARAAAMLQNSAAGHLAALLRFMPTRATATATAMSSLGTRSSTGVSASAGGRKGQQGVAERGVEGEGEAAAAAATASALHSSRPPVTVASLSAPAAASIAQDGPELLAPGFVPAAPPVLRAGSFASPLVRRLA